MNDWDTRVPRNGQRDRAQGEGNPRLALTVIQCIAARRLEFYCGNVFLTTIAPSEPGSADEVAEIYTTVLIDLLEVLEQGSNHQRIQILEGMKRRLDFSSAPTSLGLLAVGGSLVGKRSNARSMTPKE
ncbi:MAG: hypothetical protein ACJASC_002326 [Limimaricola cinnabarinus]|jgi:hypothetical protein|uniref:hypothetical protein n=1 Tax=Limimaricola cinnabarinus TaxID=1125964 RepID=UPI0039E5A5B1